MPGDEQVPVSFNYGSTKIEFGGILSKHEINKTMQIEKNKLEIELQELELYKGNLLETVDRCTTIYKDVLDNLKEKKKVALEELNETIRAVADIVADSNMQHMKIKIEYKRAVIVDEKDWCVNDTEGSACRSCTHMSIRHVIFSSLPNVFPIMIMDESFFTLSENTSVEMSERISSYSQDYIIIGIEQKDTLFAAIEDKRIFEFNKIDSNTRIREV